MSTFLSSIKCYCPQPCSWSSFWTIGVRLTEVNLSLVTFAFDIFGPTRLLNRVPHNCTTYSSPSILIYQIRNLKYSLATPSLFLEILQLTFRSLSLTLRKPLKGNAANAATLSSLLLFHLYYSLFVFIVLILPIRLMVPYFRLSCKVPFATFLNKCSQRDKSPPPVLIRLQLTTKKATSFCKPIFAAFSIFFCKAKKGGCPASVPVSLLTKTA